jgi:hypothetical protein
MPSSGKLRNSKKNGVLERRSGFLGGRMEDE